MQITLDLAELLEDLDVVGGNLGDGLLAGGLPGSAGLGVLLVGLLALGDTGGLGLLDGIRVLPADVLAEVAEDGVGALTLVAVVALGLGDHDAVALVDNVDGDTLVGDEGAESLLAALGVAGEHGADGAEEDLGGGAVVEGTELGVGELALAEELEVLDLVADLGAGHGDLLATDDGDLLAEEELLGDNGGGATENVILEVDNGDVVAVSLDTLAGAVSGDLAGGGHNCEVLKDNKW